MPKIAALPALQTPVTVTHNRLTDNIEFLRGTSGASPYGPVEYVIYHDGAGSQVRYWAVDTSDGSHVELDAFDIPNTARQSVATDKTFLFVPSATNYQVIQYAWSGTQFVPLYAENTEPTTTHTPYGLVVLADHEDGNGKYFIAVGQGTVLVSEAACVRYKDTAPFDFVGNAQEAINDNWIEAMDIRYGNAGAWDVGDAVVMGPQDPGNLKAYSFNGVNGLLLTPEGNYDPASNGDDTHSWGWCRNSGVIVTDYGTVNSGSQTVGVFRCDPSDLSVEFVGFGVTKSSIAPGPGEDDGTGAIAITAVQNGNIVVTLENMDSGIAKIRTYTRDGDGAAPGYPGTIDPDSHIEDYDLAGPSNNEGVGANSYFRVNPYTDTIYLITGNSNIGLVVFTVNASGNINVIAEISGHYASSRFGSSMTFVPTPFTNTVIPDGVVVDDRGHPVFDDQGNFVVLG